MVHVCKFSILTLLLALGACAPELDMQGVDPRDYYAAHPIKNKVVEKTQSHAVIFNAGANKPSKSEVIRLREALYDRSFLSVHEADIAMTSADFRNESRKQSLSKMLRYLGYRGAVKFTPSPLVSNNEVLIQLTYSAVVAPDCPDWRQSPSHNFSNHEGANFGCATEVNLGLMVADPRDLERGTGELPPVVSERGDIMLKNYRTAGATATAASSPTSAAETPSSDTTSVAPTSTPQ